MALLSLLLGSKTVRTSQSKSSTKTEFPLYEKSEVVACPNKLCVTVQPSEVNYLKPAFRVVSENPFTLRCAYCEHGFEPPSIGGVKRKRKGGE